MPRSCDTRGRPRELLVAFTIPTAAGRALSVLATAPPNGTVIVEPVR